MLAIAMIDDYMMGGNTRPLTILNVIENYGKEEMNNSFDGYLRPDEFKNDILPDH